MDTYEAIKESILDYFETERILREGTLWEIQMLFLAENLMNAAFDCIHCGRTISAESGLAVDGLPDEYCFHDKYAVKNYLEVVNVAFDRVTY